MMLEDSSIEKGSPVNFRKESVAELFIVLVMPPFDKGNNQGNNMMVSYFFNDVNGFVQFLFIEQKNC